MTVRTIHDSNRDEVKSLWPKDLFDDFKRTLKDKPGLKEFEKDPQDKESFFFDPKELDI